MSLTNRCNLACPYCHKEGNHVVGEDMDTDKVKMMLSEVRSVGIDTVKFTGGEPLLRDDILDIIGHASSLGFTDIGLTTNGTLLAGMAEKLSDSGLMRANIGCDSIKGSLPKNIARLEGGIRAARDAGIHVKLNMVVMSGLNDHEIEDMIRYCNIEKINLQLIELIDNDDGFYDKHFLPLDRWEKMLAARASSIEERDMQARKRFFLGSNYVELVRPGRTFCEKCNKIRITSDGRLRQCLRRDDILDFSDAGSITEACRKRDSYGYD